MLCEFGCGQAAKHQFKNGRWCCSKSANSCPENKQKNREANKGRTFTKETKLKMSTIRKGKKDSKKTRDRKSKAKIGNKNPMYGKIHPNRKTSKNLFEEHQFFCKIEKIRDDIKNNEVQVRCKFCKQWFTPTYDQIRYRIYALENSDGNDGLYFYCSEKCKHKCPLYNMKPKRLFNNIKQNYTENEYQVFRNFVLERDKYKCQYCEEKATHVHHERPQKLEPFFALDPDYAWSCCQTCHYTKGHKDECSTRKIGMRSCNA